MDYPAFLGNILLHRNWSNQDQKWAWACCARNANDRPSRAITETLGTRIIGPRNLTILSFFYGLTRDQAAHPMPNQLEGFKIGEQSKTNTRKLLSIVIIVLFVGIPINFIIYLHLSYHYGAGNWSEVAHMGRESFTNRLQVWLTPPHTTILRWPLWASASGLQAFY